MWLRLDKCKKSWGVFDCVHKTLTVFPTLRAEGWRGMGSARDVLNFENMELSLVRIDRAGRGMLVGGVACECVRVVFIVMLCVDEREESEIFEFLDCAAKDIKRAIYYMFVWSAGEGWLWRY